MEKGLFIIWNNSLKFKELIINEISKTFQITYISKPNDILIEDSCNRDFLKEFYWNKYDEVNFTKRIRYTSKLVLIIFNDLKPNKIMYNTSQRGMINVNSNILNLKHYMRKKFGNSGLYPLCHSSDDIVEFIHNIKIIKKFSKINNISKLLNYQIEYSNLYLDGKINILNINLDKVLSKKNKEMWNNYNIFLKNKDIDFFCIESSFIMSLYNIREANDLTYICCKNINSNIKFIRNHKNIIENYLKFNKEDIIFNPKFHFYCNGLKCINLNLLKKVKKNRNTEKDKIDVKLIESKIINN